MPTTHAGFQKKLNELSAKGINDSATALKYATLMLGSIELELESLDAYADNPLVTELRSKYMNLKETWNRRLKHVQSLNQTDK